MTDVTTPVQNIEFRSLKVPNMNPITAFLVLAFVAAGAGTAYWSNLYSHDDDFQGRSAAHNATQQGHAGDDMRERFGLVF
jgi:hypothetical protein